MWNVHGFFQEIGPGELTLEALLDMSDEQVCEALQKFGASDDECARLNASLTCLRSAHKSGELTLYSSILKRSYGIMKCHYTGYDQSSSVFYMLNITTL